MKRKIVVAFVAGMITMMLTGCNQELIDTTLSYDYAIIYMANGEIVEGEIEKWKDYEGEQLQVTFKGGDTYLTSSLRCDLIHKNDK